MVQVHSTTYGTLLVKLDEEDVKKFPKLHVANVAKKGNPPKFYAKFRKQYLHRVLLDAPKGVQVDHINGDSLDNRKENLRLCTHNENQQNRVRPNRNNTSGYKGVTWNARYSRWEAKFMRNRKTTWLGSFSTKEAAYAAYLVATSKPLV